MNSYSFDPPRYTYSDYKNWKDDREFLNGYYFQLLPYASQRHSKTFVNFIAQGKSELKSNIDCDCTLYAKLDWKISEERVVRPDMMIICGNASDNYLEFPPVLVVEIISPSSIKKDRVIKFELYREQGVKYYLLADYLKQTVEVFELIDNYYKQVDKNNFILDKNCKISFDFDDVWE